MNSTTRVAAILGLALVAPLAAACSDDDGEFRAVARSTAAPSATVDAASTGQRTRTSSEPPAMTATATAPARTDLPDGVHMAHIIRVDAAAGALTADLIQFLTGDAAARAAAEDGAEAPPPNDYYIRNADSRLRTLSVGSDASITVNVHAADESGSATKDISKTLAELADVDGLEDGVFRLTLEDGLLSRIAEMYLP